MEKERYNSRKSPEKSSVCEKDGLESHFDKEAEVLLKSNIEKIKLLLLKDCKTPIIWVVLERHILNHIK